MDVKYPHQITLCMGDRFKETLQSIVDLELQFDPDNVFAQFIAQTLWAIDEGHQHMLIGPDPNHTIDTLEASDGP
jgi:hypothetical protein